MSVTTRVRMQMYFGNYKSIHFAHKSACATGRCRCTVRGKGEAGK